MEPNAEQMIDAAEVIAAIRKQLAEEMPWGTLSEHTDKMSAAYRTERLLRDRAGK